MNRGARPKHNRRRVLGVEPLEPRIVLDGDADDTLDEAIAVGSGALFAPITLNGRIDSIGDVDMYKFIVEAGTVVDIDVDITQDDPDADAFNPELLLLRAGGLLIKHVGSAAAPGETPNNLEPYIRHTFDAEGTYYVGISVWPNITYNPVTGQDIPYDEGSGPGNYSLSFTPQTVADPDDQFSEARSLGQLIAAKRADGALSTDKDVDMFTFTIGAKRWVTFDLDKLGESLLDAHLRVFDSQGVEYTSSFQDTHAINENVNVRGEAYLEQFFLNSGTYYLGVSTFANQDYLPIEGGRDNASTSLGAYTLLISPLELWDDANDTKREAVSLGSASKKTTTPGVIDGSFDVDLYKIKISPGQRVDFRLFADARDQRSVSHYLRIFDARGVQIRNEFRSSGITEHRAIQIRITHRFAKGGTYYVGVSSWRNDKYDIKNGLNDAGDSGYVKSKWRGEYLVLIRALKGPRARSLRRG